MAMQIVDRKNKLNFLYKTRCFAKHVCYYRMDDNMIHICEFGKVISFLQPIIRIFLFLVVVDEKHLYKVYAYEKHSQRCFSFDF